MKSLFRYSGNKSTYTNLYRTPPPGVTRIVEPFLGSGAYSLSRGMPALGFDLDERVITLWKWLQSLTSDQFRAWAVAMDLRLQLAKTQGIVDIRDLHLDRGPELYLSVNICSAFVGSFSRRIYNQHSLPTGNTFQCYPNLYQVQVKNYSAAKYIYEAGDLIFLDPPYLGTRGGYKGEEMSAAIMALVRNLIQLPAPIIFTYGDGAPELFPDLKWETLGIRRPPNITHGGIMVRTEHVAYINFESATVV
jgi:site-specific DNA-adenine methylase